jgi:Tat protein translocase TatB subunit
MFNVGPEKLMVVLLIALIVLGPDKLPNAARQIGKYLNEFRRISQGFQQELRSAIDLSEATAAATGVAAAAATAASLSTDAESEEGTDQADDGAQGDDGTTAEEPDAGPAATDAGATPLEQNGAAAPVAADPVPSTASNTSAAPLPTPSPEAPVADAPPSPSTQPAAAAVGDLDATRATQA